MSVWVWLLIGLSIAGVLLACIALIAVLLGLFRLRARIRALQTSRLLVSVQSLQLQSDHLSRALKQSGPIVARMQVAVDSIAQRLAFYRD